MKNTFLFQSCNEISDPSIRPIELHDRQVEFVESRSILIMPGPRPLPQ